MYNLLKRFNPNLKPFDYKQACPYSQEILIFFLNCTSKRIDAYKKSIKTKSEEPCFSLFCREKLAEGAAYKILQSSEGVHHGKNRNRKSDNNKESICASSAQIFFRKFNIAGKFF
jgi:hypothetical protein